MNPEWLDCLVYGARYAIGPKWTGCEECGSAWKVAPLEVRCHDREVTSIYQYRA